MTNIETEPGPLPPPMAPIEPAERRWARSDDRVVLGVAGGLARGLAVDPLFVRIAFVVLALFSGVGLLIYVAGLLLLADSPTSPPPGIVRRIIGIGAVIASARWLVRGDAHLPDAGWVVAIGLLGIAVALWRGRGVPQEAPRLEPLAYTADARTASRWSAWTAQRRMRQRPPRSPLGWLGIGAAAVVGAMVWLFNSGAGNRGTLAFGWATAVLGAAMIVGTVVGRARWLILPAAATAAAALVAAALNFAGTGLNHHTGDRSEYIGASSPPAAAYRVGTGDLRLYLQDDIDDFGDISTAGEVGMGSIHVVVPDDARVQVDAAVGIGTIDVFGTTRNGYSRMLFVDNGTNAHVIRLRLRTGVGSIHVERYSSQRFFGPVPQPPFTPTTLGLQIVQSFGDGTFVYADGTIQFGDGSTIRPNGQVDPSAENPIVAQLPNRAVQLANGAIIDADGTVHTPGGFTIEPQSPLPTATTEVQP